jgi:hypothetical protein
MISRKIQKSTDWENVLCSTTRYNFILILFFCQHAMRFIAPKPLWKAKNPNESPTGRPVFAFGSSGNKAQYAFPPLRNREKSCKIEIV